MNLQILLLIGNQDSCILKTKTNNWRPIVFTSVCITIYIMAGTVKSNGVCVSVCLSVCTKRTNSDRLLGLAATLLPVRIGKFLPSAV